MAIRKRFGQFVATENREAFADFCKRVLTTDSKQTCEVKLFKDGQAVYLLVEGIAAEERQGQERLCRAAVIDITQQKRAGELAAANLALQSEIAARERAEEALRESEARYRSLFQNMLDGFAYCQMVFDEHGHPQDFVYLAVNDAFGRLTGLENVIGKRATEVIPGIKEMAPELLQTYGRVASTGNPERFEIDFKPLGLWLSVSAYGSGKGCFVAVFDNITQRKQAEQQIFEANQRLQSLMEAVPVGVSFSDDLTCQRITGNPAVLAQFEVTPQDNLSASAPDASVPGRQVRFFLNGRQITADELPLQRAVAEDRVIPPAELEVQLPSGRRWFADASGAPVHDSQGKVVGGIAVTVDVTDRKRSQEALVQAKAAAEAANVAKSQFLANMSHELRTPMNAILGMIDVALPKATDPTVQDCLQTAKGSADLLLAILNDVLDSARIESGKLELECAPFSLRRMLDQLTRVLAVRASENGLCFHCHVPEETPDAVVGDRMRLQQVLLNLAGNAIKFTEQGEVEVSLRAVEGRGEGLGTRDGGLEEGEQRSYPQSASPGLSPQSLVPSPPPPIPSVALEFAVRDTGIGIPPSGQERLFQSFTQADASTARRFGGTGLGLSICKNLVEMMGGRIWVESQLGKGSTFRFSVSLPLAEEFPSDVDAPVAVPAAACAPCAFCWRKTTWPTRRWPPTSCTSGAISWRSPGTVRRQSAWPSGTATT